jgi:hypothetical protein
VEEGRCWNRFVRGRGTGRGAGVVVVDPLNIVGFCPGIDFVGLDLLCRQVEADIVLAQEGLVVVLLFDLFEVFQNGIWRSSSHGPCVRGFANAKFLLVVEERLYSHALQPIDTFINNQECVSPSIQL